MEKTVTFLLVEDDVVDAKQVQRALHKLKLLNPIHIARDGVEALEMLRGEQGREPIRSPYLILLDLNMPRMNGLEFLEAIRKDSSLSQSIVFVLTSSKEERDRLSAYHHNVAGYIVKDDVAREGLIQALDMIDHYWRVVEFP